jgi:hypothetical protein
MKEGAFLLELKRKLQIYKKTNKSSFFSLSLSLFFSTLLFKCLKEYIFISSFYLRFFLYKNENLFFSVLILLILYIY